MKLLKHDVIVDDIDYYNLKQYTIGIKYSYYNYRDYERIIIWVNNKQLNIANFIMGDPPEGFIWDHKDRNTKNNQRDNLRLVTRQQNNLNTSKRDNTTSQYKGVSRFAIRKNKKTYIYWEAKFMNIRLGLFKNEINAAKAYDKAAEKYSKEFVVLNFPKEAKK